MKFVFDVDGVLVDPWTLVEKDIQNMFQPSFTFEEYCTDFGMSTFPKAIRDYAIKAFGNPTIMAKAPPMYINRNINGYTIAPWNATNITSQYDASGNKLRTDWLDWCRLFQFLINSGHDVELHTLMFSKGMADMRKSWFDREIKPFVPAVTLKIDIGASKTQLKGTVVVEDSLANLVSADAHVKILMNTFHNTHRSEINRRIVLDAGNPDFLALNNLTDLAVYLQRLCEFEADNKALYADNNVVARSRGILRDTFLRSSYR